MEPANFDEDGSGDVEGEMRKLHNSFRIQHALTSVLDKMKMDKLQQTFVDEGLEEDIRRLADLQDASAQEHTWWQQLNPETDRLLPDSEWIVAMRLRLGALVIPVDGLCGYCGERCMDSNGYHSLCCALGEAPESTIESAIRMLRFAVRLIQERRSKCLAYAHGLLHCGPQIY